MNYYNAIKQLELKSYKQSQLHANSWKPITNQFSLSRLMCGFLLRYICKVIKRSFMQLIGVSGCKTVVPCSEGLKDIRCRYVLFSSCTGAI